MSTPNWVRHAIFYQIFPDRFARSDKASQLGRLEPWDSEPTTHGFKGGDLWGMIEKLDYLENLGVNALYFNPIFQSPSNHRYHTHDYFIVDPLLGGDEAFERFLDEAHRRDIRVVLDGVFNHASRGFFQFNHILECGPKSPYLDWFRIRGFPLNAYGTESQKPNYDSWMGLPALPEFNIQNSQVREFIFSVAKYWLRKGIDGWRLDVPFEIEEDDFWRQFRKLVKEINPQAYIVGEIPWEAQRWCQGDQFDAVMNYQFTQACLAFFGGQAIDRQLERNLMGLPFTPVFDAQQFSDRVGDLLHLYPQDIVHSQLNLLSSHDMPRFLSLVGYDKELLSLAVLFQMTYPGAPCIYYGDEVGLQNGPNNRPESARFAFQWDREKWDEELLNHYKNCIQVRKAHPALRTGDFIPLYANDQVLAFLRKLDMEIMVVIINRSEQSFSYSIPMGEHISREGKLETVYGNVEGAVRDGELIIHALPPRSGVILKKGGS